MTDEQTAKAIEAKMRSTIKNGSYGLIFGLRRAETGCTRLGIVSRVLRDLVEDLEDFELPTEELRQFKELTRSLEHEQRGLAGYLSKVAEFLATVQK